MIEIETFNELFLNEKKLNKSLTLKTLAVITNMNYSYLSELNSGRKPTNKELVENLNKFLNNTYVLKERNQINTYKKYVDKITPVSLNFRAVPLVSRLAYASYTESWDDKDFIETMQTIPTFALEDGNYLWFEVKGDSMSSDASPSIEEGDYILGRELYREHWDHLQLKRTKVWVIHHQEKGLMLKEIIRQSGSEIECRSWNPIVKNFTLDLKDIVQMFYFKELRKTKLL